MDNSNSAAEEVAEEFVDDDPEQQDDPLTMSVEAVELAQQQVRTLPGVPKRRQPKRVTAPKPHELKPAKKSNAYEIMLRRQQVQRLRLRGLSISEIAKQLSVSFLTAQKDLEAVSKTNQDHVDQFQQSQFVGESMEIFDDLRQRAWDEYNSADPGSKIRLQSLDLIRVIQHDKFKALQDTGLIQKAAQQVEHTHTMALPWTDEIKLAVIDKLLQSQLSTQLSLPTPDPDHVPGKNIIDAEFVSDTSVADSRKS